MRGHRVAQVFQLAVDAALGQGRLEGERIEKDVNVLENR